MVKGRRHEQIRTILRECAAAYIAGVSSSRSSLITVTDCRLSDTKKGVVILVSVFPKDREAEALSFLQRKRGELRAYADTHARIPYVPLFDFAIDKGEENRQSIERIIEERKRRTT